MVEGKYDSSVIGPSQASAFRSSGQVKEDVEELIAANVAIDPAYVAVIVDGGKVILKGCVSNLEVSEETERAARKVIGVTDVRNELEISG